MNYPNQIPPEIHLVEKVVSRLFSSTPRKIERVAEGVSTYIYRIHSQKEILYLRVLPEIGDSFAPEVAVHSQLRRMHMRVPEVLYFEHCNEELQRSIMLTTEIKGSPVSQSHALRADELKEILMEAGRDLARINDIPVEGFGWVERACESATQLRADCPTHRSFALEHWEADCAYLADNVLSSSEITSLHQVLERYDSWLDIECAHLAHGDFDSSHIYHHNGQYTGIIDFGEIRGANRWYDLAHFHMRDGEHLPQNLLSALLMGYQEVVALPSDHEQHIRFTSVLINVYMLARPTETSTQSLYPASVRSASWRPRCPSLSKSL